MIGQNSRYARTEIATHTTATGEEISYLRRRFCPQGDDMPLLVEVRAEDDDRLDLITARTLGDPEQFWRVCDANNALNPEELEREGTTVRIPVPTP